MRIFQSIPGTSERRVVENGEGFFAFPYSSHRSEFNSPLHRMERDLAWVTHGRSVPCRDCGEGILDHSETRENSFPEERSH